MNDRSERKRPAAGSRKGHNQHTIYAERRLIDTTITIGMHRGKGREARRKEKKEEKKRHIEHVDGGLPLQHTHDAHTYHTGGKLLACDRFILLFFLFFHLLPSILSFCLSFSSLSLLCLSLSLLCHPSPVTSHRCTCTCIGTIGCRHGSRARAGAAATTTHHTGQHDKHKQ